MRSKNHEPVIILNPTFVGGWNDTYSLTMRKPRRCTVTVRTPLPGSVAPSKKYWRRMNGSQRLRIVPVVCDTANATSGLTGTTTVDSTTLAMGQLCALNSWMDVPATETWPPAS